jgi:Fur family transcriptional regulator, ferric uptake regulator
LRNSKQRLMIIEQLQSLKSHPTADDLYHLLRKQMPRISLGTVYRNLEFLSQEGLIQKLDVGGSQKRFDGNAQEHYHVRCQRCGRLDDIQLSPKREMETEAESLSGYAILRHRLEFIGICPECQTKSDQDNSAVLI